MKTRSQKFRKGSALVLALSLMAFAVLLIVSLATMTTLQLRQLQSAKEKSSARSAALYGLYEAIGEVQRTLGPDSAITANASIFDNSEATYKKPVVSDDVKDPYLLGVFPVRSGISATSPLEYQKQLHADVTAIEDGEKPDGVEWLVSSEKKIRNPLVTTLEDSNSELVSLGKYNVSETYPETLGAEITKDMKSKEIDMKAGLIEMADFDRKYAWIVSDESQKAKVSLTRATTVLDGTSRPDINKDFVDKLIPQVSFLLHVETLADAGQNAFDKEAYVDRNAQIFAESSIMGEFEVLNQNWINWSKKNRMDYTVYSMGVPADVVEGRLKEDLTVYLQNGYGLKDSDVIVRGSASDTTYKGMDYGIPDSAYERNLPRFGLLRSWRNIGADSNGDSKISDKFNNPVKVEAPSSGDSDSVNGNVPSHGVYPVLSGITLTMKLGLVNKAGASGNEVALMFYPIIELHNPNNVALAATDYIIRYGIPDNYPGAGTSMESSMIAAKYISKNVGDSAHYNRYTSNGIHYIDYFQGAADTINTGGGSNAGGGIMGVMKYTVADGADAGVYYEAFPATGVIVKRMSEIFNDTRDRINVDSPTDSNRKLPALTFKVEKLKFRPGETITLIPSIDKGIVEYVAADSAACQNLLQPLPGSDDGNDRARAKEIALSGVDTPSHGFYKRIGVDVLIGLPTPSVPGAVNATLHTYRTSKYGKEVPFYMTHWVQTQSLKASRKGRDRDAEQFAERPIDLYVNTSSGVKFLQRRNGRGHMVDTPGSRYNNSNPVAYAFCSINWMDPGIDYFNNAKLNNAATIVPVIDTTDSYSVAGRWLDSYNYNTKYVSYAANGWSSDFNPLNGIIWPIALSLGPYSSNESDFTYAQLIGKRNPSGAGAISTIKNAGLPNWASNQYFMRIGRNFFDSKQAAGLSTSQVNFRASGDNVKNTDAVMGGSLASNPPAQRRFVAYDYGDSSQGGSLGVLNKGQVPDSVMSSGINEQDALYMYASDYLGENASENSGYGAINWNGYTVYTGGTALYWPFKQELVTDYSKRRSFSVLSMYEYPDGDRALMSLGYFQHARLSVFPWQPNKPFGNSNPFPAIDAVSIYETSKYGEEPNELIDISYVLNHSMWDRFYLSTIPQDPDFKFAVGMRMSNPRHLLVSVPSDKSELVKSEAAFKDSAAHVMVDGAFNVNSTSYEAWRALLSSMLGVKYTLDSFSVTYNENGVKFSDSLTLAAPYSNLTSPNADSNARGKTDTYNSRVYQTRRPLSEKEIDLLARFIVSEIRRRGPAFGLADFVNRKLVDYDSQDFDKRFKLLAGTLDAAIRKASSAPESQDSENGEMLNYHLIGEDRWDGTKEIKYIKPGGSFTPTTPFVDMGVIETPGTNEGTTDYKYIFDTILQTKTKNYYKHTNSPQMYKELVFGSPYGTDTEIGSSIKDTTLKGLPAYLTQADLLQYLAPVLTARGDTFTIRAYGCHVNPVSNTVRARAWCEAVVQRTSEPLKSGDNLAAPTGTFGRAFKIISFRWLKESEL